MKPIDPENPIVRYSPFDGLQWLRTPALLLLLMGGLGQLRWYVESTGAYLSVLKFPPAWACNVIMVSGVIFMAIAIAACLSKRHLTFDLQQQKKWRTL